MLNAKRWCLNLNPAILLNNSFFLLRLCWLIILKLFLIQFVCVCFSDVSDILCHYMFIIVLDFFQKENGSLCQDFSGASQLKKSSIFSSMSSMISKLFKMYRIEVMILVTCYIDRKSNFKYQFRIN